MTSEHPLAPRPTVDVADLTARLASRDWVDDPFLGPVLPEVFAAESPVRPRAPRWGALELLHVVAGGARRVEEYSYVPSEPDRPPVPVAMVWDNTPGDAVVRIYCNKRLIGGVGSDRVRPPIITAEPDLQLHPVMAAYAAALRNADGPGLLAVLDPAFRHRRPDGTYPDSDDVRTEFVEGLVAIGGVPIQYVTATDDGSCAAHEFISWRTPPHAGVGVYERSEAGLIREFRGYEGPVYPKPGRTW